MARKRLSQHVPDIKEALDKGLARHLILTQSSLAKANPKDTGRMASSWFIGKDSPDRSVAPERDGPGPVNLPDYNGRIEYDGTWYISNNLPYAERVAFDPKWAKGGAGGAAWFTTIVSQMPADLNKQIQRFLPR
jgi:hypothetical protein